jgi:hypothetical protein
MTCSLFYDKNRKRHFIHMPFEIVDISVNISSSMAKMEVFFESTNIKEVKSKKGFHPKGIFSTHMVSLSYSLFFTRLDDIIEGVDDNEYTYVKTKVIATTRKTTPK